MPKCPDCFPPTDTRYLEPQNHGGPISSNGACSQDHEKCQGQTQGRQQTPCSGNTSEQTEQRA